MPTTAATELAESLLAAARFAPVERNPLVRAVAAGTLSRDALRMYVQWMASMALGFPRRIAAVLAVCDDADVRRLLIGNLLEEEGVVAFVPEEGVRIEPARRHGAMAIKLARAAGLAESEIAMHPPSAWFAERLAAGDWLGPFAYFAVGFEANVPATFRAIADPLMQHYRFTRDDLEFLIEHFVADERHGVEAAHLIARVARTDEARERALAGARRGGQAWWAFHRAAAAERVPA